MKTAYEKVDGFDDFLTDMIEQLKEEKEKFRYVLDEVSQSSDDIWEIAQELRQDNANIQELAAKLERIALRLQD